MTGIWHNTNMWKHRFNNRGSASRWIINFTLNTSVTQEVDTSVYKAFKWDNGFILNWELVCLAIRFSFHFLQLFGIFLQKYWINFKTLSSYYRLRSLGTLEACIIIVTFFFFFANRSVGIGGIQCGETTMTTNRW